MKETEVKKTKARNTYGKSKTGEQAAAKDARRAASEARVSAWREMTLENRLRAIVERPGRSERELERLIDQAFKVGDKKVINMYLDNPELCHLVDRKSLAEHLKGSK